MLTFIYLLGAYITFMSMFSYFVNNCYIEESLHDEIGFAIVAAMVFPITWLIFTLINIKNSHWYKKLISDITYDLRGETQYKIYTLKGKIISKEEL